MSPSCLSCSRVKRCTYAREVALSIFLQVKVLSTSAQMFESAAAGCADYSGARRKKSDGRQLTLSI